MPQSTKKGFGALTKERRQAIASKGGKAAHVQKRAHQFTSETARAAGRLGGIAVSRNREHMARIGRKGGHVVSQDRGHMTEIGQKGGHAPKAAPPESTS